jgi:hypothetical protein
VTSVGQPHVQPTIAAASPLPAASSSPSTVTNAQVSVAAVSGGSNAAPAIAASPLPAPSGYGSKITIPIATVPAGTTLTVNSSTTLPTTVPPLASSRRGAQAKSVRIPQATDGNTAIFFDSIVPSANITVAGNISATQAFPAGTLTTGTTYYLGFYDSTQPNPAWQTIGSATTSDNLSLTFTGTVGSTTLQANDLYAFAIFTTATGSTPPPAAPTLAYLGQGTAGLVEVNSQGTIENTLPFTVDSFGLDDSGNVYTAANAPTPAPVASGQAEPTPAPPIVSKYPAGSTTASLTYTPSNSYGGQLVGSGTGAFMVIGEGPNPAANPGPSQAYAEFIDVWDAGSTGGAPSRTLILPASGLYFFGVMGHDGTIYAPQTNADGTIQYNVYPPGSSQYSVIPESVVPPSQQSTFAPNYAAVGSDGTFYVTEYTFQQPDALAGLYVYPKSGAETFVPTYSDSNGAGPQGVDVDASGNVYVVNNNSTFNSGVQSPDTLNDVEIFGPRGVGGPNNATTPLNIMGGANVFSAYSIAVAPDGTAFFSSNQGETTAGSYGTWVILAGATSATQINDGYESSIVLYDGTRETTGLKRRITSSASGSSAHGGGGMMVRMMLGHRHAHAAALRRR